MSQKIQPSPAATPQSEAIAVGTWVKWKEDRLDQMAILCSHRYSKQWQKTGTQQTSAEMFLCTPLGLTVMRTAVKWGFGV